MGYLRCHLFKSRDLIALPLLTLLFFVLGCSQPMSKISSSQDGLIQVKISDGITSVPITFDKSYYEISSLPAPQEKILSAITFIIDINSLKPSRSSASEDINTIAIWYKFQIPHYIDKLVDPNFQNYYTMYKIKDRLYDLIKLSIPPNLEQPTDQQDQSFILLRPAKKQARFDTLIECQQFNVKMPALPCEMVIQFPNSITAFVRFNRDSLKKWKLIRNSVERFSSSIRINKGSL